MKRCLNLIAAALVAFAGLAGVAGSASAQRGEWVVLGTQKVSLRNDKDVIDVSRHDGRFNALRVRAIKGRLKLKRMRVVFGNGEDQRIEINQTLRQGQQTAVIDLDGRKRSIDRIELVYRAKQFLGSTRVEVLGRRVDVGGGGGGRRDRVAAGRRRGDLARGWKRIAQRVMNFNRDRNSFRIARGQGRFNAIQFEAVGGPVRLDEVRVTFRNGSTQRYDLNRRIADGATTDILDLKGGNRAIREIELFHERGRPRARRVRLLVYGLPPEHDLRRGGRSRPLAGGGRQEWSELGTRNVDLRLDRDTIRVERGEGPFSALALRADGAGVYVYDIRVTYGNDRTQEFRVDLDLRPGERTRAIDLKGRFRNIRRVELLYEKSRNTRRRARITVLGRGPDRGPDRGDGREPEREADAGDIPSGFRLLGTRRIGRGRDADVIRIARGGSRVSRVLFRVVGGRVSLRAAHITFRDGSKARVQFRSELRDGDRTEPIDLPGGRRRIDSVELEFKGTRRRGASIELFGAR